MGKIVVSENVTLDGVIQDPTGEEGSRFGGWFDQMSDKDREAWAKVEFEEALGAEALLLGARSYEYFAVRWASRSGEWADRLNTLPKYVVSSTLSDLEWNNSTVLRGDVVNEVGKLKRRIWRGHRRLRQRPARAHVDGTRPRGRAAADGPSVRPRDRRATLRRDQRPETGAPGRHRDHRRRPSLRDLRTRPRRPVRPCRRELPAA